MILLLKQLRKGFGGHVYTVFHNSRDFTNCQNTLSRSSKTSEPAPTCSDKTSELEIVYFKRRALWAVFIVIFTDVF